MKRLRIIVKGKVQGVYFRVNTKREAKRHQITGFVYNQPDGSVFIEAQGTPENLEAFVKWCHRGPLNAVVENVNVEEIMISHGISFSIY